MTWPRQTQRHFAPTAPAPGPPIRKCQARTALRPALYRRLLTRSQSWPLPAPGAPRRRLPPVPGSRLCARACPAASCSLQPRRRRRNVAEALRGPALSPRRPHLKQHRAAQGAQSAGGCPAVQGEHRTGKGSARRTGNCGAAVIPYPPSRRPDSGASGSLTYCDAAPRDSAAPGVPHAFGSSLPGGRGAAPRPSHLSSARGSASLPGLRGWLYMFRKSWSTSLARKRRSSPETVTAAGSSDLARLNGGGRRLPTRK